MGSSLDRLRGGMAHEKRAAASVSGHPHLSKFIDETKSVGVAGSHGVWQTQHTGPRPEKAFQRIKKIGKEAEKLSYKKTPSGAYKHPSGSRVELVKRSSTTPSGREGHGVEVSFHYNKSGQDSSLLGNHGPFHKGFHQ